MGMGSGMRVRMGSRAGNGEQGWEWGVGWDVARAVEQEPEHRARPGFRTRRDKAAPVAVPPRPHCLGAGAEGREAPAERQEAPAAPAPADGPSSPAMASAPRLALLAAALLCAPGKWERHREWHRERQLAPGTAPGTDADLAPHHSRRPAGIRSRVVPQPGSILSFPHVRGPSVPPGSREPGRPHPLLLLRVPRDPRPPFRGDPCPLHRLGSRGGHPGNVGSAGISRGESPPSPHGIPPPEGLPFPPDPGICLASPRTPDPLGGIESQP